MISWIFCINLICLEKHNPFEVVGIRVGKAAMAQLERKKLLQRFSPPGWLPKLSQGHLVSFQFSEVHLDELKAHPHNPL